MPLVGSDTPALGRVMDEWQARIAAEYTSATITQELVLWLMVAGAPPDLIDEGLAIVADELAHSRLSYDVFVAAGGTTPPSLVREHLGIARRYDVIELDILATAVRVFCLGETVAVPLFKHLRAQCTQREAKTALDRILKDEVRHRDFGWDLLDWLSTTTVSDIMVPWVTAQLPLMFAELMQSYGYGNDAVANDDGHMNSVDRSWGLAPPRAYAEILERTFERDYVPRFVARGVAPQAAWAAAHASLKR
jgi:hypothetical protein